MSLGNQNNMLRQRYVRIVDEVVKLVQRMAKEHLPTMKDQHSYVINNIDFLVS